MAARQIQSRLLSLFASRQPKTSLRSGLHFPNNLYLSENSWKVLPSANSFFGRDEFSRRRIGTLTEPGEKTVQRDEASALSPDSVSSEAVNDNSAVKFNATTNLKISSRHDLAMVFTCKVCETRSMKTMCRESYEKGVVVVRCGGCNNLHLIADHRGWFGEPGTTVEEILAARGEEVKKGSIDTLNFTLQELVGKETEKTDG